MRGNVHAKLAWALGTAAVLGGIAYFAYWVDQSWPWQHFRSVEHGVFYRSAQLEEDELVRCIEGYRIKTVINLRSEVERGRGGDWYGGEKRAIARTGIRHVDVPLPEGHPPTPAQIEQLLAVMDDPASRPVLIHCEKGTIRSAAVEGLWRREYLGETGDEAYARVETWGRDLQADYPGIADFIRNYVSRAQRAR
ncbi:MAG: tyrosine-protein phosphatase [Planctomycetota bacterium]|nr:tyrosine-protein phosphatase [Planctomycetota bacterium]